jgi:hypothetical protein
MSLKEIWGKRDDLKKRREEALLKLRKGKITEIEYRHICEQEEQLLNHIALKTSKILQV